MSFVERSLPEIHQLDFDTESFRKDTRTAVARLFNRRASDDPRNFYQSASDALRNFSIFPIGTLPHPEQFSAELDRSREIVAKNEMIQYFLGKNDVTTDKLLTVAVANQFMLVTEYVIFDALSSRMPKAQLADLDRPTSVVTAVENALKGDTSRYHNLTTNLDTPVYAEEGLENVGIEVVDFVQTIGFVLPQTVRGVVFVSENYLGSAGVYFAEQEIIAVGIDALRASQGQSKIFSGMLNYVHEMGHARQYTHKPPGLSIILELDSDTEEFLLLHFWKELLMTAQSEKKLDAESILAKISQYYSDQLKRFDDKIKKVHHPRTRTSFFIDDNTSAMKCRNDELEKFLSQGVHTNL